MQGHRCHATVGSRVVLVPALLIPEWASIGRQEKTAFFCVPSYWSAWSSSVCPMIYKIYIVLSSCLEHKPLLFRNAMKRQRSSSLPLYVVSRMKESRSLISLQLVYLDWVHSKAFCTQSCQDVIFLYEGCLTVQSCLDKSLT